MSLVAGKTIAAEISAAVALRVKELNTTLRLAVITCNPNFETKKYLALKKTKAQTLGIVLEVIELPETANTEMVLNLIKTATTSYSGIIVQLPLPLEIDIAKVIAAIPATHDVDAFGYEAGLVKVLPPVVGAIAEIAKYYQIDWKNKQVVVFGSGRLVGSPAAYYAKQQGAMVTIVTETTPNPAAVASADIIILGVGKPNLLKSDAVKEGVLIFDAGASEDGGVLAGDADPEIASKAALFTPVPGGIGPITIALLFRNLLELHVSQ
jgi:methylenetetrahydrofolate dehydrogenase (NADP+)/methenyltetrahydrofolate cyclohydrolase